MLKGLRLFSIFHLEFRNPATSSLGNSILDLPRDAFERVDVAFTGAATFARLLSSGIYPGKSIE